jgi:hypothetical protein
LRHKSFGASRLVTPPSGSRFFGENSPEIQEKKVLCAAKVNSAAQARRSTFALSFNHTLFLHDLFIV